MNKELTKACQLVETAVKQAREQCGATQKDIAESAEVQTYYIWLLEHLSAVVEKILLCGVVSSFEKGFTVQRKDGKVMVTDCDTGMSVTSDDRPGAEYQLRGLLNKQRKESK